MSTSPLEDRTSLMTQMISQETALLQKRPSPYRAEPGVFLTGATGSTGSYILRALIADVKISRIYCLVRAADARQRLLSTFPDCAGLKDEQRVVFIKGSINDPQLGIKDYELVRRSIRTIIHTAWLVNYNSPLPAYQEHITGLRYLVNMLAGSEGAQFIFVSSMFSIGILPAGKLPCKYVSNPHAAVPGGYGESKFVAESILNHAASMLKIGVSVLRVGQISGPLTTNVPWKHKEWFPIMLKTSKYLRMLPTDFGSVDWTPVDKAADIVYDVYVQPTTSARFLNVLNDNVVRFKSLAPAMQRALGPEVQLVSRKEWIEELEKFDPKHREISRAMPALRLLWFYKNFPVKVTPYDVEATKIISPTFRTMGSIRPEWIEKWIHDLHDFIQPAGFSRAKLA